MQTHAAKSIRREKYLTDSLREKSEHKATSHYTLFEWMSEMALR